jgi:hypothetical protein
MQAILDWQQELLKEKNELLQRRSEETKAISDFQLKLLPEANQHRTQLQALKASFQKLEEDIKSSIDPITELSQQLKLLQEYSNGISLVSGYFNLLKQIEIKSNLTRSLVLHTTNDPLLATNSYLDLCLIFLDLKQSSCTNLNDILLSRLLFLQPLLKTQLYNLFTTSMAALKWPQTAQRSSSPVSDVALTEFATIFLCLLKFQLYSKQISSEVIPDAYPGALQFWPIDLLIKPIKDRFFYHFDGDKPTNRIDKPEWFLTYLQDQIQLHIPFLDQIFDQINVQWQSDYQKVSLDLCLNFFDRLSSYASIKDCLKDLFLAGLVNILRDKITTILPMVISKPVLLRHYVDELLVFQTKLYQQDYPSNFTKIIKTKILVNEL